MATILEKVTAELKRRADLNGDGKVDQADVAAAVAHARLEAEQLVSRRGALAACVLFFVIGLVAGGSLVRVVG